MADYRHADLRTEKAPFLAGPELIVAVTMLFLSAISFLLPTALALAIMAHAKLGGIVTTALSPLFATYSFAMGSENEFIRDFWVMLPALIVGVFAARPRTRDLALCCVAVLMIAVALVGSLALQFPPSDFILSEVALVIGQPVEEHRITLRELPDAISQTRAIAIAYLTAALAKAVTEKANQ